MLFSTGKIQNHKKTTFYCIFVVFDKFSNGSYWWYTVGRRTMTSLLKVSTNIITSITTRYIRLAAILMSVSTFKTDIIIYLCCHIQKLKCECHYFYQKCHNFFIFQYQSRFIDTENITLWGQRKMSKLPIIFSI
jgi:hypothetical protein